MKWGLAHDSAKLQRALTQAVIGRIWKTSAALELFRTPGIQPSLLVAAEAKRYPQQKKKPAAQHRWRGVGGGVGGGFVVGGGRFVVVGGALVVVVGARVEVVGAFVVVGLAVVAGLGVVAGVAVVAGFAVAAQNDAFSAAQCSSLLDAVLV